MSRDTLAPASRSKGRQTSPRYTAHVLKPMGLESTVWIVAGGGCGCWAGIPTGAERHHLAKLFGLLCSFCRFASVLGCQGREERRLGPYSVQSVGAA